MVFLGLSVASAVLLAVLAIVLWVRRPPAPLWPIVFVCQVLALLWVVGDLWATHARSVTEKQLAFLVLFTGSILIVPAWWETTRRYVRMHGLGRPWMDSRWAQLPLWYAGAAWLLMATNFWHGQFITPVVDGRNQYHWGVDTVFYVNYAMGAATVALCGWAALRHPSPDVRRKLLLLIAATLAPAATNVLHLQLPGWPREDTTAIGLGTTSVIVLYGILRVRLFSPMPATLAQTFERVSLGILMLDRGGRLVAWNPAAQRVLDGIDLQPDMRLLRILARVLTDGEHGGRLRSSRQLTDLLAAEPRIGGDPVFRYRGSGEERWLELSVIPVPARRGGLKAVCLAVSDVTEQRRATLEREALATQLREVDKLQSLGRMAGGVAHDFNNLLTSIVGNAQLALDELPPRGELREYLDEIRDSANRAAELTDQLIAYSGRGELIVEPISLSKLVEEASPVLTGSFPFAVELRTQLSEDLPALDGDRAQLRQVILNLVVNAVEALPEEGGFVTVRTGRIDLSERMLQRHGLREELEPGVHVLLEVHDSGCGMTESTRLRAFEPFFTTRPRGRGLGLAAVFGIVRAHHGAVTVESEPGRGSTFRVWLPASSGSSRARLEARETLAPPSARCDATILVVDDQESVRRVASRVLGRAGHRVHVAASTRDAVRLFRRHRQDIDLVLLDLTMPELGGDEALRQISAIDPQARVLIMSGFDETDAMQRLSSSKLGGFIHKPWRPDELLAAVQRALAPLEAEASAEASGSP